MRYEYEKEHLPSFPKTAHLPFLPQATREDLIASAEEAAVIFSSTASVEEKLDGANAGVYPLEEGFFIRNRDHILRKGYDAKTPAKKQFAALWTWVYDHEKLFRRLVKEAGQSLGVYGEWLYAEHSIRYSRLPELFIPFDLYEPETHRFWDPHRARKLLTACGFVMPPLLYEGQVPDYDFLARLAGQVSNLTEEPAEGVYVKVGDGTFNTGRFKMVRPGFKQQDGWNKRVLVRNRVQKDKHAGAVLG